MLNKLMKLLGFSNTKESELEISELKKTIELLKQDNISLEKFFCSAYTYIGDYPNWKVQQEFRDLISINRTHHADAIDDYLGVLVDATRKCMIDRGMPLGRGWETKDDLDGARGERGWDRSYSKEN
jgi:hypothetical protein